MVFLERSNWSAWLDRTGNEADLLRTLPTGSLGGRAGTLRYKGIGPFLRRRTQRRDINLGRPPFGGLDKLEKGVRRRFLPLRKAPTVLRAEHHETAGEGLEGMDELGLAEVLFPVMLDGVIGVIPGQVLLTLLRHRHPILEWRYRVQPGIPRQGDAIFSQLHGQRELYIIAPIPRFLSVGHKDISPLRLNFHTGQNDDVSDLVTIGVEIGLVGLNDLANPL